MGFKERLREARVAAKLTGEALGAKLAVSKATVSHWENGRYEPNLDQLKALCDELQVSADWLLERAGPPISAEAALERGTSVRGTRSRRPPEVARDPHRAIAAT